MAPDTDGEPISITIPGDAKPAFANATQVTVLDDAVVLQFAYVRANSTNGQLLSEVILSPKHAIEFNKTLGVTIKKHFTRHLNVDEKD